MGSGRVRAIQLPTPEPLSIPNPPAISPGQDPAPGTLQEEDRSGGSSDSSVSGSLGARSAQPQPHQPSGAVPSSAVSLAAG